MVCCLEKLLMIRDKDPVYSAQNPSNADVTTSAVNRLNEYTTDGQYVTDPHDLKHFYSFPLF